MVFRHWIFDKRAFLNGKCKSFQSMRNPAKGPGGKSPQVIYLVRTNFISTSPTFNLKCSMDWSLFLIWSSLFAFLDIFTSQLHKLKCLKLALNAAASLCQARQKASSSGLPTRSEAFFSYFYFILNQFTLAYASKVWLLNSTRSTSWLLKPCNRHKWWLISQNIAFEVMTKFTTIFDYDTWMIINNWKQPSNILVKMTKKFMAV